MPRGKAASHQGATAALIMGAVLILIFALSSNTVSGITQSIINAFSFSFSAVSCPFKLAAGMRC